MADYVSKLISRLPGLGICESAMRNAVDIMERAYAAGRKVLVCGNGGSAADAEHITGELMKGFMLKRPLTPRLKKRLASCPPELVERLQMGVPAISLVSGIALPTAFANDVCHEAVFAQQVVNLGKAGDVLLSLSTSGNSPNVIAAMRVAKALNLASIGLTGSRDCEMRRFADVLIAAPAEQTCLIQELHLPIYHALCAELERRLFGPNEGN